MLRCVCFGVWCRGLDGEVEPDTPLYRLSFFEYVQTTGSVFVYGFASW